MIYDNAFYGGTPETLNHTGPLKAVLRILVTTCVSALCTLPFWLLDFTKDMIVLFIFKSALPF